MNKIVNFVSDNLGLLVTSVVGSLAAILCYAGGCRDTRKSVIKFLNNEIEKTEKLIKTTEEVTE